MSKELSNAFILHQKLLESISFTKTGFVVIGKLLHHLYADSTFLQAVGEGINTWDDYISQPEICLARGEASRLIQIYEQFVLRLGLSEEDVAKIPLKNIHYLLPIVKGATEENADEIRELVEDARVLSQKDFKERVYEAKHEEQERTYEYLVMKRCHETGVLSKIHNIPQEAITALAHQYNATISI